MLRAVPAEHYEADQVTRLSLDRAYGELLQEVRIAQMPVQVLLAFLLLWLAFSPPFGNQERFERHLWLASVVLSLAALALLVAPGCYHRLSHPRASKQRLLALANACMLVGMALLFASVAFAVWLILGATLGFTPLVAFSALVGVVWFATWWCVVPLMLNRRER